MEELTPVVVVIVIVAAWVVILGPNLLKRRARSGGDQSISHFHYQLRVLEQRAPEPLVTPAYRLRAVDGTGTVTTISYPDTGRPPVLTVVGASELPRPALAFLGEPEVPDEEPTPAPAALREARADEARADRPPDYAHCFDDAHSFDGTELSDVTPVPPPVHVRGPDPYARSLARRRRRDTLLVLGAVFLVAVLTAGATGATLAWAVAALDGVALAAYVGLLVHLRRMAAEREAKLHYLDPLTARPSRSAAVRPYMSGRYAHPSNQRAVAH